MPTAHPTLRVLALRHGHAGASEEPYGRDTLLSALGQRQVRALAAALVPGPPLDAVYVSPFPRALQTAEPLCARLGFRPVVDERLAEYSFAPSLPGERPDLAIWQPHHRGLEEGETLEAFGERVADCMEELCARHEGDSVALVAHSGTIDAMARWAMGMTSRQAWQHDLPLPNASITELRIWPRGRAAAGAPRYVAFERIGDVDHLGPELRSG